MPSSAPSHPKLGRSAFSITGTQGAERRPESWWAFRWPMANATPGRRSLFWDWATATGGNRQSRLCLVFSGGHHRPDSRWPEPEQLRYRLRPRALGERPVSSEARRGANSARSQSSTGCHKGLGRPIKRGVSGRVHLPGRPVEASSTSKAGRWPSASWLRFAGRDQARRLVEPGKRLEAALITLMAGTTAHRGHGPWRSARRARRYSLQLRESPGDLVRNLLPVELSTAHLRTLAHQSP